VVLAGLVGLVLGSFATLVAYRVPRGGSIVRGRSRCPRCDHVITASENIPLLSYLVQRGRCRHCGTKISARYPLIELSTSALFVAALLRFGISWWGAVFAGLFWVLVVLTVIDLEHRRLPDRVVYPAFVTGWLALGALALIDGTTGRLGGAAIGALIFGGFLFAVAFAYPAGMGGGDVKLALVLGTFLGYLGGFKLVLAGMFFSFVLGGLAGVAVVLARGGGRKTQVPFGPFLAAGTVIAILAGESVVRAYLGTF
jgi:leader peptidase (prepilin peptidase)/N-methyltransferase